METAGSVLQGNLPLEVKLQRAREELLDLSARSRLLNVPRSSRSAKTIEVVDGRSDEVFRFLVRERRAFTFQAEKESPGADNGLEEAEEDVLVDLPQPEDELDERGCEPHRICRRQIGFRHAIEETSVSAGRKSAGRSERRQRRW